MTIHYRYSRHAAQRAARRRISQAEIEAALAHKPRWNEPRRVEVYRDPVTGVTVVVSPYKQEIVTVYVQPT